MFYISKRGGQNYRNALNPTKIGQKIKIDTEKSRFGCNNNDTDIILDARKSLHWKEISNETRDANIRLYYGKTMFAAQVSKFAVGDRHCSRCQVEDGKTVDETFIHGCYDCPYVKKHYKRVADIFGFRDVENLTAKDTFVWKRYYKQGLERDFDKEIFFKFINLHTYAELNKQKKYGFQPTFSNLVTKICGAIVNTVTFFKTSRLGYALSRQSITGELLKSGFSPWIQSRLSFYDAIDNFVTTNS